MLSEAQRSEKRRLVRRVIALCLLLIPALGYAQYRLLGDRFLEQPRLDTAVFFALINFNALLLLLMLYLVLRQLAELFFERRHRLFGFRLRGKLVAAFVALSFLPTTLLFLFAFGSIGVSMNYWFNARVEDSLQSSANLAQSVFADTRRQAEFFAAHLARTLESGAADPYNPAAVRRIFGPLVAEDAPGAPDGIHIIDENLREVAALRSPQLLPAVLPPPASAALRQAAESGEVQVLTAHTAMGELVQAVAPVRLASPRNRTWHLVVSLLIPTSRLAEMRDIQTGLIDYRHQIIAKAPMKLSLNILLIVVTMLIVFGSIWLGLYIARTLTTPIDELALATRRVAEGDLEVQVAGESDDEMGVLVSSFNAMTARLAASRRELAQTHQALRESNEVSERRRGHLETVLEHVPAGVITMDETGRITTINRFAVDLLAIDPGRFLGRDFHEVLPRLHAQVVEGFIRELAESGKPLVERHLRMTIRRGEALSLQVNVARMADEQGQPAGIVIVFDDLTNLEQAQRLAAWQEVARRIAHEIKNPLTPIQLSAQRLRKRYLPGLAEGREVFDQCTGTIISQVEELRRMVSEFSEFARMPKLKKEPGDLAAVARGVLGLYRAAHQQLVFEDRIENLPPFAFDAVQIKRVLINLLDNAVAALDSGGRISVGLAPDEAGENALLTVADDGPGIPDEVKLRVFEPYFSTHKSGTGLGLAICRTIVSEHGGSIQAADNQPQGAAFVVTLPVG